MLTGMASKRALPEIDVLRKLVRLDEATGRLYWLPRPLDMFAGDEGRRRQAGVTWNKRWAGREAFCTPRPDGYRDGALLWQRVLAHRVVFALVNGRWPVAEVDHLNHERGDNRPENLREATHLTNHRNQSLRKNNTSGVMGVYWQKNRHTWNAAVMVRGRSVHLGSFQTYDEAVAARRAAERRYGFHENHGAIAA